jgi:hypothetical protein
LIVLSPIVAVVAVELHDPWKDKVHDLFVIKLYAGVVSLVGDGIGYFSENTTTHHF